MLGSWPRACTGGPGRPIWTPGRDYHDNDANDDDNENYYGDDDDAKNDDWARDDDDDDEVIVLIMIIMRLTLGVLGGQYIIIRLLV